jgi:predicted DNA-binding transcriptional regulator YafY
MVLARRRSRVYHPTTRVLTLLELLQSHPRLSSAELAARLQVDPRTVRRYVARLQDLGVPVWADAGRNGGYRLRPGFKLPPLMFTEEEALALVLGLLAVERLGLGAAAPAVQGALAKLDRVLPPVVRARVQAAQATLAFTPARVRARPTDPATILALSGAAQDRHQVWLRYQSARGEETGRVVDAYGLVHHRGRWYLVGWCHLRQGVRLFRVDRVLSAEPREETFAQPADFDCAAYVLRSLASVPYGVPVEVLLELAPEQARRRVPPDLATLEETPEGVVLRTQADQLEWMARMLVGLECRFAVRQPPELRDTLRALAAEISALAER